MAKQSTKAAANEMQSMFDPQGYRSLFHNWAEMNQRMTEVMVESGQRMTDITAETTHEGLENLRDAMQVRDDSTDYMRAYSDLMQKQMELASRAMQSVAELGRETGRDSAEIASEQGQKMADKATDNVEQAADKASSAAKKAS